MASHFRTPIPHRSRRSAIRAAHAPSRWWVALLLATAFGALVAPDRTASAAVINVASGDVAGRIGAINTANTNGEDDTINLAAGTYTLTAVDNNDVGPSGLPSVTSTIAIVGAGAGTTIVERDTGAPDFRIFTARLTHDLTLRGMTIRNGQTPSSSGGGVYAVDGRLTIDQCTVTANSASYSGGVEFAFEDGAVIDSDISGNSTPGGGGGIRFVGRYEARVLRTTITGNDAGSGGGISVGAFPGLTGRLVIADSSVTGNAATANIGGGIEAFDYGLVTISRTTISGNTNANPGGAVAAWGTRLVMTDSTVSGNPAAAGVQLIGGTLYISTGLGAEMTATNSTFSGNGYSGIVLTGGSDTLRLSSSTITGNQSGIDGLLGSGNSARLRNTIVSGNASGSCDGKIKSDGNNIFQSNLGCTIAAKSSDLIDADPMLGALANNGGPTMTHALPVGSAAIDAGASCLGHDQRGFLRPADGNGDTSEICDIGAVEENAALVTHSPDHFLCYKAKTKRGTTPFVGVFGFSLVDQFETKLFDSAKGTSLCTPADKFSEGIVDPVIHLRGYQAKAADGELPHVAQLGLRVQNQIGELQVDTVKVERLLVPSTKDLIAPPLPPGASNVDSFKCYKVKTSSGTAKLAKGLVVDLQDQLEHRLFDVVKPTRLCMAVNRAGGGVLHPTDHLMCYKVKLSKPKPLGAAQAKHTPVDAFTANDLDDETLTTVKEEDLCVPSTVTP